MRTRPSSTPFHWDIDATGTDAATNTACTIDVSGPISPTTDFLAINLESGSSLTIAGTNGSGGTQVQTIGGNGSERGFFVYAGNVTLENLTIEGGGGAGLGGGLFVASAAAVSLENVR